jgi:hypothetical protein
MTEVVSSSETSKSSCTAQLKKHFVLIDSFKYEKYKISWMTLNFQFLSMLSFERNSWRLCHFNN